MFNLHRHFSCSLWKDKVLSPKTQILELLFIGLLRSSKYFKYLAYAVHSKLPVGTAFIDRGIKKKNHWVWQHSRDGLPACNNHCVCHADFLHCASHLSAYLASLLYGFDYLKLPTLWAISFESSNSIKHRAENWWNVWGFFLPCFLSLKKTEDTGDLYLSMSMMTTGFSSRTEPSNHRRANSGDGLHVYIPKGYPAQCLARSICQMHVCKRCGREKIKILFEIGNPTREGQHPLLLSNKYRERYTTVAVLWWQCCSVHWLNYSDFFPHVFSIPFLLEKPRETKESPNSSAWRWKWATCPHSSLYTRKVYLFPFRWNVDHSQEIQGHFIKFYKWGITFLGRLIENNHWGQQSSDFKRKYLYSATVELPRARFQINYTSFLKLVVIWVCYYWTASWTKQS